MEINLQIIIDTICNMFLIALPFSLVLSLVAKITNIFTSFVFNREVRL